MAIIETPAPHPLLMHPRPGLSGVDNALPQKQFRPPVPGTHQICAGIHACPHYITDRLHLGFGNRHGGDLTPAAAAWPNAPHHVHLHPIPHGRCNFDRTATTHSIPTRGEGWIVNHKKIQRLW
jgi:hypothetical protein